MSIFQMRFYAEDTFVYLSEETNEIHSITFVCV